MPKYRFEEIAVNCIEKRLPDKISQLGYIGLEHLDAGCLHVNRWGSKVPLIGEKLVMHKGDVLLGKRNAYLRRAAICPHDGLFSAHGMVLQPKEMAIDRDFFPLFIASDYFFDEAIRISVGSLSPTINWSDLRKLEFNLPCLEEQRKLASILWSINSTIEAYQRLLHVTDELVKSQFIEMLKSEICDYKSLEQVCMEFTDGDWIESKDQSKEGIRLIQTGNIGNGVYIDKINNARYIDNETFYRLQCTEVKPNDILVSRLPEPIGRACIVPSNLGKMITAVDCSIIRLKDELLPEFFVAYTLTPMYQSQVDTFVTGSTRKRISRTNLGNIKIPVPKIGAQYQFASIVHQSNKSKFMWLVLYVGLAYTLVATL